MTIDEANELAKTLVDINKRIWYAGKHEKAILRDEFKSVAKRIINEGFEIKKHCTANDISFKAVLPRHADCFEYKNNRPNHRTVKGDCTTRTICSMVSLSYDDIMEEQHRNAKLFNGKWNMIRIWSMSLTTRGYVCLRFKKRISRATFLTKYGNTIDHGIIATVSSGHVAAINMHTKKILDTWNSSGGRIRQIYVPEKDVDTYKSLDIVAD